MFCDNDSARLIIVLLEREELFKSFARFSTVRIFIHFHGCWKQVSPKVRDFIHLAIRYEARSAFVEIVTAFLVKFDCLGISVSFL
jgi:hypothetical protein